MLIFWPWVNYYSHFQVTDTGVSNRLISTNQLTPEATGHVVHPFHTSWNNILVIEVSRRKLQKTLGFKTMNHTTVYIKLLSESQSRSENCLVFSVIAGKKITQTLTRINSNKHRQTSWPPQPLRPVPSVHDWKTLMMMISQGSCRLLESFSEIALASYLINSHLC